MIVNKLLILLASSVVAAEAGDFTYTLTAAANRSQHDITHNLGSDGVVVQCTTNNGIAIAATVPEAQRTANALRVTMPGAGGPFNGKCHISGGAAGSGVSHPSDLLCKVTSTATVITMNTGATAATPCNYKVGDVVFRFTSPATTTRTGGSGTGTIKIYLTKEGVVTVDIPTGIITATSAGATHIFTPTPAVQAGGYAIADLAVTGGTFSTTPVETRAFYSTQPLEAGDGIGITNNLFAVDPTVMRTSGIFNLFGTYDFTGATVVGMANGSSEGAPTTATYITQTADALLTGEQALATLSTGPLKVTSGTGILSSGAINLSSEVTGTLSNANTTAVSANTNSAIVARDGSGNFSATMITAALAGNASTATALAANPADCTANQFATTIAASGALTCAAIVDNDVPNTITVSNYLPLAGGVMTGQITANNLGVEFTDSDAYVPATNCQAGNYNIFADLSELKLKKCTNGTVSDLDTGGGAAGSATWVQYAGAAAAFASEAAFAYDATTNILIVGAITTGDGTAAGETQLLETTANGSNYISWLAPAAITANLRLQLPNANPTAGQVLSFGVPAANISTGSWITPAASTHTHTRTVELVFIVGSDTAASALVDADDQATIFWNRYGSTFTITEIGCESDAGTPSINLVRDDGTPANILTANLSCSTAGATSTTFSGSEATIAATNKIDFGMQTAGGTAKRVTVTVKGTITE